MLVLNISLVIKQPERKTDQFSAQVKNAWNCTSSSSCLHGVVLN
jgi:hypothetical protein